MNIPLNIDWQQILLHLFNFTVLFAILYFLLYSPVKKFIADREKYFKDLDDNAKENLKNAEAAKAEYENKLNSVSDEIIELKEKAQIDAANTAKITIEKSKAEAEKILEDAKNAISRERNKMLSDAKSEISDMVACAVKKIVTDPEVSSYDSFLNATKRGEGDE